MKEIYQKLISSGRYIQAHLYIEDLSMSDDTFEIIQSNLIKAEEDYFSKVKPKSKKAILDFKQLIQSVYPKWVAMCRMNYLNELIDNYFPILSKMHEDKEEMELNHFFRDNQIERIKKMESKIKKYIDEHQHIKQTGGINIGFSEAIIEKCREVSLLNLEPLNKEKSNSRGMNKFCCPFHGEKTPSFMVYKDNSYHCFGCRAHGANAIDYLIQLKGISFTETIKFLIKEA